MSDPRPGPTAQPGGGAGPDPLMSIGVFSRASLVSIKALRSYHEQGLLVPAEVDAVTGYRSYRVSQLADAQVIKRLRDLDVPLRDIADVMSARDPEITRKVLAEHEVAMRARLVEVAHIVDELQQARELPTLHTPVHVRREPASHVLAFTGAVEEHDYSSFLGDAYGRLWSAVGRLGLGIAGPSGALYPAEVRGGREEVVAYLPIDRVDPLPDDVTRQGIHHELLPEVTGAVMTHQGSFASIGDTYRQLGAWVAGHATTSGAPVRERYVVSVDPATGELLPDDELRTEIVWPIHEPDEVSSPQPGPEHAAPG